MTDIPAVVPVGNDPYPARLNGADKIVQYLVRGVFLEYAYIPVARQVEFERLFFDEKHIGDITDREFREIRKPCFRADGR